jgi:hypothetical protein
MPSGYINLVNFTATVNVGGEEILDWSGFSVTRQLGDCETQASVDLKRPINVSPEDTLSITAGYGGGNISLVNNKPLQTTQGGLLQKTLTAHKSDISRKAPSKDIYFINQTWLKKIRRKYWIYNGNIFWMDPGNKPIQLNGVSTQRLFIDGLPGKNIRDNECECVIQQGITYHDIARYLASLMGYDIIITVPNLTVFHSLVVSSQESYFAAIGQLFSKYNPAIYTDNKDGRNTIYVVDAAGDNGTRPSGTGCISLSEDSFSLYDWNETIEQVVDHLIITGPPVNWVSKRAKPQSTVKKSRSVSNLSGEEQILVFNESYSEEVPPEARGILDSSLWFEFSKGAELRSTKTERKVTIKTNSDTGQTAKIKEETKSYRSDNTLVHKVVSEFQWADYDTPTGSTTKEWRLLGVPGGGYDRILDGINGRYTSVPKSEKWKLVSVRDVEYGDTVGDTGLVDTQTKEYSLVYFWKTKKVIDGQTYWTSSQAQPVDIHSQIGNWFYQKNPDDISNKTHAAEKFVEISRTTIRYNVISSSLVEKNTTEERFIPMYSRKTFGEEIPLKRTDTRGTTQRRWEFYKIGGDVIAWNSPIPPAGTFHPKVMLNEPDVIDGATALQIALRFFKAKPEVAKEATVKLNAMVPGLTLASTVRLPACSKEYFDWKSRNWETVTIESQLFWLVGITDFVTYEGDPESDGKGIRVETSLRLKETI